MSTLGITTQPANSTGTAGNMIDLVRIQATENGTVDSISGYLNAPNASWGELIFVVYDGDASEPKALRAQSDPFFSTPDSTMGLRTHVLNAACTLVSGNYYWVGSQIEHDASYRSQEASTGIKRSTYYSPSGFNTLPNLTGLSTVVDDERAGYYVNYTGAGGSFSIDTLPSSVTFGDTGQTLATTGLTDIASMTIDGLEVPSVSATGGDGTWSFFVRTTGAVVPPYGSDLVVTVTDTNDDTADSVIDVVPSDTQDWVQITSVVTTEGYLGAEITLTVGDQIAFDLVATLDPDETLGLVNNYIDVDGGIFTDYIGSQTIWHWNHTTGVVTSHTLITGEGETIGIVSVNGGDILVASTEFDVVVSASLNANDFGFITIVQDDNTKWSIVVDSVVDATTFVCTAPDDLPTGGTFTITAYESKTKKDFRLLQNSYTDLVDQVDASYYLYTGSSATTHTVTHNTGTQYCNVMVIDSADNTLVIPQSITFNSANQLTVVFTVATAVKIAVVGQVQA